MSYAEHGPRIFLAGSGKRKDFRGDQTLTYGDYVLPRKRSEGRLKAYESCTDIRAWSQNTLDNTRYIHELAEHSDSIQPGKIVPLNVVIDNVIGLGAQTQNELSACRRELQRYKSLTLTPEQQHQLQSACAVRDLQSREFERTKVLPPLFPRANPITNALNRNVEFLNTGLVPVLASPRLRSRSKPPQATNTQKIEFGGTTRAHSASPMRSSKPDSVDKSLQTGTVASPVLQSRAVSAIWLSTDGTSEETRSEPIDNAATAASGKDELAFIGSTSGDEYTDDYEEDGESTASRARNRPEIISSFGTPGRSDTETGSGTGSVTDYETDDENNKSIIIKKDSEIIALKNEIGAKEMEIDELRERNKLLEASLKVKEDGIQLLKADLKMSEQQFAGVGDDIMYESEMLKKKIAVCECAISELKSDLKEKASMCRAQAREIEELRFHLKETELLRVERNSLLRKVNEMGDLLTDAEKCGRALTEMKSALRERDELRNQNREQSCLLADQEEEIQRLVLLVRSLSAKHEGLQVKMKGTIENMRLEIDEKNCKICECEAQLSAVEKEVDCLNVKLKNSLNSMDEFKVAYQDACNCADLDRDVYSQAKSALCKLNQTMTELKEYKLERENLLRQIEEMKYNKNHTNNNLARFCCQNSTTAESEMRRKDGVGDLGTLDLRKRKCALQEELEEVEDELRDRLGNRGREDVGLDEDLDVVASAKRTINRLNNAMLDLDAWECEKASMQETIERLKIQVSTLSGKEENGDGENVERRIVDQASYSLAKLSQLFAELKQYQIERQMMQKKIRNLTEALKDSQSAEGCKGIKMLKERLRDLRIENEKERLAHAENIKSLQARLEEAENTSSCSGVKALRQKLRESLKATGTDVKVDQALAIHVKKSIERLENLSKEIKEVDEERVEIVKEIAKQQEEIEVRNVEIVRLKKQVAWETAKRQGEGDRAEEGLQELEMKIRTIRELEDQIQSYQFQLLGSNKEQASLKQRIKEMENEKIELLTRNDEMAKKIESANTEMSCLMSKVTSSERIHANLNELEAQFEEMKPRNIAILKKVSYLIGVTAKRKREADWGSSDIEWYFI
ncbi:myosin-11-like [Diprion similis]|uniref:myosin-11-like n=1 Tax=Diprion similis TaxID=362088 RepID=UPI001EF7FFD4|nr:myosin-11-like [Diprion similis]